MADDHPIIEHIKSFAADPKDGEFDQIVSSFTGMPDPFRSEMINKLKGWTAADDGATLRQGRNCLISRGNYTTCIKNSAGPVDNGSAQRDIGVGKAERTGAKMGSRRGGPRGGSRVARAASTTPRPLGRGQAIAAAVHSVYDHRERQILPK